MNSANTLGVLVGHQLCDALLLGDRVMSDTLMQHGPDLAERYGQARESVVVNLSDRIRRSSKT